jgi:hypothetical protein
LSDPQVADDVDVGAIEARLQKFVSSRVDRVVGVEHTCHLAYLDAIDHLVERSDHPPPPNSTRSALRLDAHVGYLISASCLS